MFINDLDPLLDFLPSLLRHVRAKPALVVVVRTVLGRLQLYLQRARCIHHNCKRRYHLRGALSPPIPLTLLCFRHKNHPVNLRVSESKKSRSKLHSAAKPYRTSPANGAAPGSRRNHAKSHSPPKRRARRPPSPLECSEEGACGIQAQKRSANRNPELSATDRSPTPPPPRQSVLRRRMSVTMPGSLYPRSPSPEDSTHAQTQERHVRFQSATPRRPCEDAPSTSSHPPPSPQPFRSPLVPSVKTAVSRFQVGPHDANPSILLPKTSPTRPAASKKVTERIEVSSSDEESEDEDYPPRISASAKGKQRASTSFLDGDTSGQVRVYGKERELHDARVQFRKNERRWEEESNAGRDDDDVATERSLDKERIKMLELEVKRLKDEVRMLIVPKNDSDFPRSSPSDHLPTCSPLHHRLRRHRHHLL